MNWWSRFMRVCLNFKALIWRRLVLLEKRHVSAVVVCHEFLFWL